MPYFVEERIKHPLSKVWRYKRYTEESIVSEIEELLNLGVKMVALFLLSRLKKKKMV